MRERLLLLITVALFLASVFSQSEAQPGEVENNRYPAVVEVMGKKLRLVGTGLRKKWFFDVYTIGVYSESGSCEAENLISSEEVKNIHLYMLRHLSADQISDRLTQAVARNTPREASSELRSRIRTFLALFRKELTKGASMQLTYIPEVGVLLQQNGEQQGEATPGKDFAEILWSAYFGSKTCCRGLKKQILSSCRPPGVGSAGGAGSYNAWAETERRGKHTRHHINPIKFQVRW